MAGGSLKKEKKPMVSARLPDLSAGEVFGEGSVLQRKVTGNMLNTQKKIAER